MIKEGLRSCVEAGFCLQRGTLIQHDNAVLESASHLAQAYPTWRLPLPLALKSGVDVE